MISDFLERYSSENGPCFQAEEFVEIHYKLGITVGKSSSYDNQSVGCVERMVQTMKQIMVRNTDSAWLAMLICKATDIPGINKSPGKLLNTRKFRTNLPTIDLSQMSNETDIEKLANKDLSRPKSGKELSKIPVGMPILYDKNPDSSKVKCPNWCKGTVKDRKKSKKL